MELKAIYQKLLTSYGPQGWWPVTRDPKKGPEYFPGKYNHPENEEQAWEIVVGAILTQNTSWKNVEKAITNLRNVKALGIREIFRTPLDDLAELIRPSGYYNQKAERLKTFAGYILGEYNGNLSKMLSKPTPELRQELLSIKGIGRETADSIILYAGNKPIFIVDAYTRRILSRLGIIEGNEGYDEIREMVESEFLKMPSKERTRVFKEFHALLVEHGKRHCKKKPICKGCPLLEYCNQNL